MALAKKHPRRRAPLPEATGDAPASRTAPFRQILPEVTGQRIGSANLNTEQTIELPGPLAGLEGDQLLAKINDGTLAKMLSTAGDKAPELATLTFAKLSDLDIKKGVEINAVTKILEQLPPAHYWYIGGKDGPQGVEMPPRGFPEGLPYRLSRLVGIPEEYRDWVQDKTERVMLRMGLDPAFEALREHGSPAQSWQRIGQEKQKEIMARSMDLLLEEYGIPRDKLTLSFFDQPRNPDGSVLYGSCSENPATGEIEVALNTNRDGPFHTLRDAWDTVTHELTHVLQAHLARTAKDIPDGDPLKEAADLFAVVPRDSARVAAMLGHRAYEAQVIERDAREAGADGVAWLRHYGRMPKEALERRLEEIGGAKQAAAAEPQADAPSNVVALPVKERSPEESAPLPAAASIRHGR